MSGAQLQGAQFNGAQMQGAYLRNAQMQETNLRAAQLDGADLFGAQLQDADLSGAQMRLAHLRYANIQGANFSGTKLQGSDFSFANMKKAVFINYFSLDDFYNNYYSDVLRDLLAEIICSNHIGYPYVLRNLINFRMEHLKFRDLDILRNYIIGKNSDIRSCHGINGITDSDWQALERIKPLSTSSQRAWLIAR